MQWKYNIWLCAFCTHYFSLKNLTILTVFGWKLCHIICNSWNFFSGNVIFIHTIYNKLKHVVTGSLCFIRYRPSYFTVMKNFLLIPQVILSNCAVPLLYVLSFSTIGSPTNLLLIVFICSVNSSLSQCVALASLFRMTGFQIYIAHQATIPLYKLPYTG